VAYDIVKTIFDHKPELVASHRDARFLFWSLRPEGLSDTFSSGSHSVLCRERDKGEILVRKVLPLLILIGIVIIAGGFLFFQKVTLLHIENMDRQRTIHIRITPTEPFSLFYIHSIYREPVVEEFQVDHQAIILKGVRTKSLAIMEYYGFQESDEFHPMDLKLGAVFLIRRGMGEGQGLIVRDRKII